VLNLGSIKHLKMQRAQKSKSSKKNKQKGVIPIAPPPIPDFLKFGTTFRYIKTSTATSSVYTNCLGKLLFVALTTTTACSIVESIRVRRVTVRAMGIVNNSAGGFGTSTNAITLRFDDGPSAPFGSEKRYTAIPTSTAGVMVTAKPPGMSANWLDSEAAQAITGQRFMTIDGPQGTLVDVKVTIQLNASKISAFNSLVIAVGSARNVWCNYLDNTNTSGTAGTQILQNQNSVNNTVAAY